VAAALPEQLKTITGLFADATGWTQPGEQLDAQSVRRMMERYFELAQRVISRHGAVEARATHQADVEQRTENGNRLGLALGPTTG
jgi:hypothetical protein